MRASEMPERITALENLASALVGDDRTPNLFFVSDRGVVITVTRSPGRAFDQWNTLAQRFPLAECALEDRLHGVLCSVAPDSDEPGARLVTVDDFDQLGAWHFSETGA